MPFMWPNEATRESMANDCCGREVIRIKRRLVEVDNYAAVNVVMEDEEDIEEIFVVVNNAHIFLLCYYRNRISTNSVIIHYCRVAKTVFF